MTQQALNSLVLYRGQDPSKIKQLLNIQATCVVNELMDYMKADDVDELAVLLSMQ
jgi:hypothetical protein